MRVTPVVSRSLAMQTFAPYPDAPDVKIQVDITKYDDATEKRMAALAASESEVSPYHPSKLYSTGNQSEVPKWTTDFWKITRHDCAH
eukprot:CAMPEP_0185260974 /NCGR_PEP_ID=MMETSP1359-20130426/9473_1 /TAXON_ID=552665 /ORGANISM="Bigelowiella longifila, Strain CCMP242" /LENGTH=86 /DNA_ID=CAMNT_0027847445 /DNA_START=90 /DNA_END=350 /DNA_ORIENTATION=+